LGFIKKTFPRPTPFNFNPPWTIFYNGEERDVNRITNNIGVEIGVFDSKIA